MPGRSSSLRGFTLLELLIVLFVISLCAATTVRWYFSHADVTLENAAILLAREVTSPAQPSLGLLDAVIERNAYGRQADSFETTLEAPALGGPLSGVFIRAPRFRSLGPGVTVLASLEEEPVLVQEGRVIAGTFHPELAEEGRLHRYFVDIAHAARPLRQAAASR